jgi:hypothetical protein
MGKHHAPEASIPDISDKFPEDDIPEDNERVIIPPAPPKRRGRPPRALPPPAKKKLPPPTINIPNFSEWHDFLGTFVIRWIARAYVAFTFRGIDRYEVLSAIENEALELDDQQLSDIAKPLAHIADRSKFGKKYGRVIIDSSDGIAALIQFTMWANRVNRIAKKVRPERGKHDHRTVPGEVINEGPGGTDVPEGPSQAAYNGNAPGHGFN